MAGVESLQDRVARSFAGSFHLHPSRVDIRPIPAGFTGTSKFTVDSSLGSSFLKVADTETGGYDAKLLRYEANIYEVLHSLGLTRAIFPDFRRLINRNRQGLRILVLENLSSFSWGDPWDYQAVNQLDQSLDRLHSVFLDEQTRDRIIQISHSVQKPTPPPQTEEEKQKRNEGFLQSWTGDGFKTAEGEVYFSTDSDDLPQQILAEADDIDPNARKALIMHDLNPSNIGISKEGVYFVDPVFARIGDPNWDRTKAGIHILAHVNSPTDPAFRKYVVDRFLTNSNMLARLIKYFVSTAAIPQTQASPEFLKLHQRAALAALRVFTQAQIT